MVLMLSMLALLLALRATAASTADDIPACQDPEPVRRLDSYLGLDPEDRFYVDVKWSGAEFVPVAPIAGPRHHCSLLEWSNLGQWPVLGRSHDGVLRVRARHLTSEIQKVPRQHRWWATYRAAIEAVCVARAEATVNEKRAGRRRVRGPGS